MQTAAVVMNKPEAIALERVELVEPGNDDVVVAVDWSGISTGTERLLWTGQMPSFPGMGYPLVPGYESVGRVIESPEGSRWAAGDRVFIPGSTGFKNVRALFGGAASRLVVAQNRLVPLGAIDGPEATLLALAATAYHAAPAHSTSRPDLIVGHGVVGRLLARLALAHGHPPPTVWETNAARRTGGHGYAVVDPADDDRRDYKCICDASGDAALLDTLIGRLAPGGEIILAGFYHAPLSFAFAPAFMREARIRVAAQFLPADLLAVRDLVETQRLELGDLVTHRSSAEDAEPAYRTAFGDPDCLKMILDWRQLS